MGIQRTRFLKVGGDGKVSDFGYNDRDLIDISVNPATARSDAYDKIRMLATLGSLDIFNLEQRPALNEFGRLYIATQGNIELTGMGAAEHIRYMGQEMHSHKYLGTLLRGENHSGDHNVFLFPLTEENPTIDDVVLTLATLHDAHIETGTNVNGYKQINFEDLVERFNQADYLVIINSMQRIAPDSFWSMPECKEVLNPTD